MSNARPAAETARHRAAFEVWYSADQSFAEACQKLQAGGASKAVPERTLRDWAERYGWRDRAKERDAEAEAKAHREAVKRKTEMLRRHAEVGKGLVNKAATWWAGSGAVITKPGEAVAAIRLGVEIERQSEGLPAWVTSILGKTDDELVKEYGDLVAQIGTTDRGDAPAGNRPPDSDEDPGDGSDDTAAED